MFLFRSSFPELDKCASSIKQVINADESVINSLESSATPAFDIYAENQPEEMKNGLKTIKETYKTQYEYAYPVLIEIKTLPTQLEQLRILHNSFQPERKVKGLDYEKHEIAKYNLTVAQNNLDRLRQQGSDEKKIKEAENKLKIAEDEEKQCNNYDTVYEKNFIQYENNFIDRISQPLDRVSKKWAESSRSTSELADKFEESTHGFQLDSGDKTIEKLESILAKIDEQIQINDKPLVDPETSQVSPSVHFLVQDDDTLLAA